jgi:hypothetical protein
MRIIVGPTMAKQGVIIICNERLSIETECIFVLFVAENENEEQE